MVSLINIVDVSNFVYKFGQSYGNWAVRKTKNYL